MGEDAVKLQELVNANWDKLNENDVYVWKIINKNKKECSSMSIEELGSKCNVSRTTILRFAKKLGLSGFSELKFKLKSEKEDPVEASVEMVDLDLVQGNYIQLLNEMKAKNFDEICELIECTDRIFVYGTGMLQRLVAHELLRLFGSIQKFMFVVEGEAEVNRMMEGITPKDLVIVISITGEAPFTRSLARRLNVMGVPYISITELSNNVLARLSTCSLYVSPKSVDCWTDFTYHSTSMFFVLIEYMWVKYLNYTAEKKKQDITEKT